MKKSHVLIRIAVFFIIPAVQRMFHLALRLLEIASRKLDALGFSLAKRLPAEEWEKIEKGNEPSFIKPPSAG